MLRPIPARILRSTATVQVATAIDMYQSPTYTTYTVQRVHLQPTDKVVKSATNSDQSLTGILFVDARISSPALDWRDLFNTAHLLGGDMKVTVRGITYTVVAVDGLRDDTDHLHHWEISLV